MTRGNATSLASHNGSDLHGIPVVEICVEGLDGLLAAQRGGADRAELCASLVEGGITPSMGTVKQALRLAKIPFYTIVRPRGGDFLYSETEFQTMLDDVEMLREIGAPGIVIGCLTADGRIDEERMKALASKAGNMQITCHRAFDMTADPHEALEALIRCGVHRVLTSGQRNSALEGAALTAALVEQAGDRIIVMGCGRLNVDNIAEVRRLTGLREMHFSAPMQQPSAMIYRNLQVGMGGTDADREYRSTVTNPDAVRATIAAARA
ncbi:copper homeostasis protein CutC [Paradevosia shaoguanensis]|uniref:copper homeostasis protein CutC n=1 Tax=Paradevosia shaoguanensis TaxID=1335043 RepID=UPI000455C984|nr:copper homeostasis protein CutC [Paradevosia shaoguanensis]QMV01243.1 copper homeostasis protein CutC [Devosia sp. D6-9]CDP50899.1 Cytoplasmic copper homeostasis protein cutC [Devosia sp. DBB001]